MTKIVRATRRTPLLLSLVVCIGIAGGAPGAAGSAREQLTRINVVVLPLEPTAQAFYAHHRGFFRRQGLDVNITVLSDPQQIVAAVLSGNAHFSSLATGILAVLKSRNAPIKLVAAGAVYQPKAPTTALVTRRGTAITRARDLVGKRIAIDAPNTPAHIGLLKWLKRNGVGGSDVQFTHIPFAQMLDPLARGDVDAAVLPEPFLTIATQRGARRVAHIFQAVCRRPCLLTVYIARRDIDPVVAARFRNAIQAAAVWANQKRNQRASGAILARYAPLDRAVLRRMTRTTFATRLRPALAQPWIDVFAEFGVIPATFKAIDLVR